MKLLTKYNRINIVVTTIALLVSGVCYYFFIHYQLINRLDKDLVIEQLEITDFIRLNDNLPKASVYKDQMTSFELMAPGNTVERAFTSRDFFSKEDNDWQTRREFVYPVHLNGRVYKVKISKSQQETDELIQSILLITLTVVVGLLIVLFIVNRLLLNKLWRPFNTTLRQLKDFNLAGKKDLQLEKTEINEFADLNNAVNIMGSRVMQDYEALKSFTENASHEIQTPLAIIQSKLELLMQSDALQEEQVSSIQSMHNACIRLSKLNQSLILLTKIDNHQFQAKERINITGLIQHQLDIYEELMAVKQITVISNIADDCYIKMNEAMAEILFSNLVTNAIKHNIEKGKIEIKLTMHQLVICNTGPYLNTDPAELFERFKKGNQHSSSLGLGLSIVKKICDQNNFSIDYQLREHLHILTIHFN
ncbi:MAG: HAMP domain-containing sensor histidine kinase [Ferruginibacter sp.]